MAMRGQYRPAAAEAHEAFADGPAGGHRLRERLAELGAVHGAQAGTDGYAVFGTALEVGQDQALPHPVEDRPDRDGTVLRVFDAYAQIEILCWVEGAGEAEGDRRRPFVVDALRRFEFEVRRRRGSSCAGSREQPRARSKTVSDSAPQGEE